MEPYWTQTYTISDSEYIVGLYRYSARSIALKCDSDFGKMFSYKFKDIGGLFNRNLDFSNHQVKERAAGWIFKSNEETQEKLNLLLSDIYEGKCNPAVTKENTVDDKKIFNNLQKLITSLTDEKKEIIFLDNDDMSLIFYYNYTDEDQKEGDCIYSLLSSRKKLEIHQINKKEQ